ncbi:copper chaperone PCu(A)C [Devosia sp.]|uniref:copper chaperone PCu(A)C n=1 Tax=Devosia sp. TaxID=1871048 RepID=UPI003F7066B0
MMRQLLALGFLLSLVVPASAHGFSAADIEIVHPFFRETPPGAKTGAGYVILRNKGSEPDKLIGIETEAAAKVTFHRTVTENGMAKMLPIEGGLEIPAGGEYRLGLDGSHAMLEGLTAPIGLGFLLNGTLIFEKAGRVDITFEVEPVGTTQDKAMQEHEGEH